MLHLSKLFVNRNNYPNRVIALESCFPLQGARAEFETQEWAGEDRYLLAYKKLRACLYERDCREYAEECKYKASAYGHYEDWLEDATDDRAEYLSGEVDGDELLRRINPDGESLELTEFTESTEPEPLPFSSSWGKQS